MQVEYHVLHFTSKPLKKKVYSPSDIRLVKIEPPKEDVEVAEDHIEVVATESNVTVPPIQELEMEESEEEEENEVEVTDQKPSFLQMFFGIKPKEKKRSKRKNKNESKLFDIWEDVPEEPMNEEQLEVAKIINQDGYYNTIKPEDEGQLEIHKLTISGKVVGLIAIGIAAVAFLIVEAIFVL